ncbi:unnamed protein product [Closterium sp. NIES-53]
MSRNSLKMCSHHIPSHHIPSHRTPPHPYSNMVNNRFSGELPTTLGNLTSLTRVELGRNYFTGTLPTSLGQLTSLISLWEHLVPLLSHSPPFLSSLTSSHLSPSTLSSLPPSPPCPHQRATGHARRLLISVDSMPPHPYPPFPNLLPSFPWPDPSSLSFPPLLLLSAGYRATR